MTRPPIVLTNIPDLDEDRLMRSLPPRRPNTLPLPPLLATLITEGRWRQPSDEFIAREIPILGDPVDFLSEQAMRHESGGSLATVEASDRFYCYRGSISGARELPWVDVERLLMVAVNREIGVDIAIALDYRTSFDDPRVVASQWVGIGTLWREIFPTFTAFVERFGL